jgi:hypothetical protein
MTTGKHDREKLAIGKRTQKCEEIELLLVPYMSRELGGGRADLVHEHLRKCPSCQAMAREIQDAMDVLATAKNEDGAGDSPRLSDERRKDVYRAAMHPVIHWIENHHAFISVMITIVILVLVFLFMYFKLGLVRPFQGYEEWKHQNRRITNAPARETSIPVQIGREPAGAVHPEP